MSKDIAGLDNAICYACGQELHDDKKEEILSKKTKELDDAKLYAQEINVKLSTVVLDLEEIGDINKKPNTFYESIKEAYDHRSNVDNLKQSLLNKEEEQDPYEKQIKELKT